MFTTSRPPKYNGPVNGRDTRSKLPADFLFPDEEGEEYNEMLEYLSIYTQEERSKTPTMVYACPNCEVRIANEEDMVSRPFIWSEQELSLNAVFKKTSNLVAKGGEVCCYRCSDKLFDYCSGDPFLLTIPMFQTKNRKTLLKRPYRMLSLTCTDSYCLFVLPWCEKEGEGYTIYSKEERLAMQEADDYPRNAGIQEIKEILRKLPVILESFGKGKDVHHRKILTFNEFKFEFNNVEMQAKALSLLENIHSDFGAELVLSDQLEYHDAFTRDKTYDVALLFRTGVSDNAFICHTDFNDDVLPEAGKLHILPWLVSGGNFVFADWGSFKDNLPPSDSFDADAAAEHWAKDMVGTNKQPTFAKLLRDGHFIGSWSVESPVDKDLCDGVDVKAKQSNKRDDTSEASDENYETTPLIIKNTPTPKMLEKIERALCGDLLYPNWLFLHDYPSATFTETFRTTGLPPFATTVKDAYLPKTKGNGASAVPGTTPLRKCTALLDFITRSH